VMPRSHEKSVHTVGRQAQSPHSILLSPKSTS
jgi:hypothetical protein